MYFSNIDNKEQQNTNTPAAKIEITATNTVLLTENKSEKESEQMLVQTASTSVKPRRELPKTSSIASMFKDLDKQVVSESGDDKIELNEANVLIIWQNFLNEHKDNLQNAFINAAKSQQPKLEDDKIILTATNNVTIEFLQLHRMDITAYFRKKTNSQTVAPDFRLERDASFLKGYKTPKDRLKDMIDNNKAVLKLIEKFDLNMD